MMKRYGATQNPAACLGPCGGCRRRAARPRKDKPRTRWRCIYRRTSRGFSESAQGGIGCYRLFVTAAGDLPVVEIRRADVKAFIDHEAAQG